MVYVVQRDMTFDLSNTINPKYKRDVIRFYSFSPCTQHRNVGRWLRFENIPFNPVLPL